MGTGNDWNPEQYLKFGQERTRPAVDLVRAIAGNPARILDLGCGPGNSGEILLQRWPEAALTGVDTSPAMIEAARQLLPQQTWVVADAFTIRPEEKFDLVFSNAAIQWIPDHAALFIRMREMLNPGGVLAIQVPVFHRMPLAERIAAVAGQPRFREHLDSETGRITCHKYSFYYDLLQQLGMGRIDLWETSYLHPLPSHQAIIAWIETTGMKPYLDALPDDAVRAAFKAEVLEGVRADYPPSADGMVLFPFPRLFMVGYCEPDWENPGIESGLTRKEIQSALRESRERR
jgi:trans-aconitate 2-methyltransferase